MDSMNPGAGFENYLLQNEAVIRLVVFFTIFFVMLIWELVAPKRLLSLPKALRWSSNLGLLMINSIVLRLIFPAAAVGFALSTTQMGWGFFNQVEWPFWLEVLIAVLLLDLAIYLQHLLMHRLPWLWRLHRVHHADLDIDLTTGSRFHTIEILVSMLIKWGVILLLGPAALAVIIFEVVLNGMSMFNHANVNLPVKLDKFLRCLFVTPDMHRVHHSILVKETNSNYGFNLSLWDRLFNTYIDQPLKGHQQMTIGIPDYREVSQVDHLAGMLSLPFVKKP